VSDRIKLKYLLYIILFGEILALTCLANLNGGIFYVGYIIGNGITSGMYNVLMAVTWPRFYGREHLGRITGFVMSLIVFASAMGPILLSITFSFTGGYSAGFYALALLILVMVFFSFKADNPQDKFTSVQDFR
jgi:sugar phosphate permease